MADLTVQEISRSGLKPTMVACAAGGDAFVNGGKSFLLVNNADVADHDVSIDSQVLCDQGFDHNITVNVPAGEERLIGPFPAKRFNDVNGKSQISYPGGDVTSLTIAAIKADF